MMCVPRDNSCWTYSDSRLVIDLKRTTELSEPGGAIRLKGKDLPDRRLVIHGNGAASHAFSNRCKHYGPQTRSCARRSLPRKWTLTTFRSGLNIANHARRVVKRFKSGHDLL